MEKENDFQFKSNTEMGLVQKAVKKNKVTKRNLFVKIRIIALYLCKTLADEKVF